MGLFLTETHVCDNCGKKVVDETLETEFEYLWEFMPLDGWDFYQDKGETLLGCPSCIATMERIVRPSAKKTWIKRLFSPTLSTYEIKER